MIPLSLIYPSYFFGANTKLELLLSIHLAPFTGRIRRHNVRTSKFQRVSWVDGINDKDYNKNGRVNVDGKGSPRFSSPLISLRNVAHIFRAPREGG
ncbi:hypothetical protein HNY73_012867 [Argiope bruennichi]|uniref:Uncharacterized protein n=1 Tax=Argiope bruennichi TaxID=94029 RepID=A0A8T0EWA8_ARGBR|nr:hypothetical protein HNY73_012867 [Argiope bruennichi]